MIVKRMKIWIDILTPKQVNFFAPLTHRLKRKGHDVFLTTRKYREANELLERLGLDAVSVGRHGGARLEEKLMCSTKRVQKLILFVKRAHPDVCLSFSSPEAARVAFGTGIPHLCVSDSPHATAVSRLTIPLSKILFTPSVIPLAAWTKYGISRRSIVCYDALDPVVWLRNLRPSKRVLNELGLDHSAKIVTLRSEESRAAYLNGRKTENRLMPHVTKELTRTLPDLQIVLLARYDSAKSLRKTLPKQVVVPTSIIDSSSLISYSSVFIGAGGTMNAEAALLGVPCISCYPSDPTYVDKYLIRQGLVKRETTLRGIVKTSLHYLRNQDMLSARKSRAQELLHRMEDPLAYVERGIAQLE